MITLRPYQERGVAFLRARDRALLGDDMGLGKTPQALLATADLPGAILIVVPASLRRQWLEESQRFVPQRHAAILSTADARHLSAGLGQWGPDTFICSYETARDAIEQLAAIWWEALICDEAHYLKSGRAKRTRCVKQIAATSARVHLLTGTPVLARQSEIVSILKVLDSSFGRRARGMTPRYLHATLTRPEPDGHPAWMLRRCRADVLTELPPKERQWLCVDDDARLARFVAAADRWLARAIERVSAECAEDPSSAANKIRGLELAAIGKRLAAVERANVRAAAEVAAQHLENGARVILGAKHVGAVRSMAFRLRRYGVTCEALHGQVPTEERDERKQRFTDSHPAPAALSLSYGVGSLGLNLQTASVGVAAGLEWTPAILRQWEDRMHRMGQESPVTIIYVLSGDSVEKRVMARLQQKLGAIAELVGDADSAQSRSKRDVLAAARRAIREESPALADLARQYGAAIEEDTEEEEDELEQLAREARARLAKHTPGYRRQRMAFNGSGGGRRSSGGWSYEDDGEPIIPVGNEGQPAKVVRRAMLLGVEETTAKSSGKPMLVADFGIEEGPELVKVTQRMAAGTSWLRSFCDAIGWPIDNVDGPAIEAEHAGKTYLSLTLSRQDSGAYAGRLQVDEFAFDSVQAAMGATDEEVPF